MAMFAQRTTPAAVLYLPGPGYPPGRSGTAVVDVLANAVPAPPPATAEPAHARYRWYLGHQAAFCVWRLLKDRLRVDPDEETPSPTAEELLDAYSVLLLYSGSCRPEVYREILRPAMADAHPAFSGTWARDYRPIPTLLRDVLARQPDAALASHAKANLAMHVAVGERLVPGRNSLLRQAGRSHHRAVTATEYALFDEFFLVSRADVDTRAIEVQLVGRLDRIVDDITVIPLPELVSRNAMVHRLRAEGAAILGKIARSLRTVCVS